MSGLVTVQETVSLAPLVFFKSALTVICRDLRFAELTSPEIGHTIPSEVLFVLVSPVSFDCNLIESAGTAALQADPGIMEKRWS